MKLKFKLISAISATNFSSAITMFFAKIVDDVNAIRINYPKDMGLANGI